MEASFTGSAIFEKFKTKVTVGEDTKFSSKKSFSSATAISVPPGQTGWIVHGSKHIKGTGTLTAKIGGDLVMGRPDPLLQHQDDPAAAADAEGPGRRGDQLRKAWITVCGTAAAPEGDIRAMPDAMHVGPCHVAAETVKLLAQEPDDGAEQMPAARYNTVRARYVIPAATPLPAPVGFASGKGKVKTIR